MSNLAMMMAGAGVAGLSLLAAEAAQAQQPAERPAEALGFLIGEWEGTGWAAGPDGQRGTFRIHELIQSGAAGHAVSLHGVGRAEIDGAERVVHDAFAMIWAAPEGGYRIRSVVMQGYSGETSIEVSENGFTWGVDAGSAGETRYTATVADDVWHEVGERRASTDAAWEVFLEMTLERVE